jgi:Ca2+-binding EF-hand superfamily protein
MVDRMMQLDKNDDGKLSKDEVPERVQSMFARADANEDDVVTREELRAMASRGMRGEGGRGPEGRPGREGNPGEFLSRMFEQRDANKDGKLSKEEMPEQMAGRLEQIDTNDDGSVSREEMEAAASRMRERGRAGRGGPEDGGRPGGDRPRRPEAE